MNFKYSAFFLAALVAAASASPVSSETGLEVLERDNCQNYLGDCYSYGCEPTFAQPSDTTGTCTAGTYNGCPCEKCGGTTGSYTGGCDNNGCDGVQGVCTGGNYDGCSCN